MHWINGPGTQNGNKAKTALNKFTGDDANVNQKRNNDARRDGQTEFTHATG